MKISLRKAHALQQEIRRVMGETFPSITVKLDESVQNDHVADLLEAHRADYTQRMDRYIGLSETLAAIRARVAAANEASGVNALLSELAHLDRMVRVYTEAANNLDDAVSSENVEAIRYKLDAIRNPENRKAAVYRFENEVTVALNDREGLSRLASKYRRQRVAVNDQLLEANVSRKIELTEGEVELLREVGLID